MEDANLIKIVRADLFKMAPYEPAPSLSDLEEKYVSSKNEILKLDQGENPYGSPTIVRDALSRTKDIFSCYPDPEYKKLRTAISKYVGMDMNHIMVGSGSDELLDLILRLILEERDEIISCPPTYGMYPMLISLNKGKIVSVPRNNNFSLDIKGILNKVSDRTKAILICSPNNPTGNVTAEQEIKILLDTGRVVIVDEAYFEFCDRTVVPLCKKYNNLIVLRTFSKWAGLAGLRLGYVIMDPFFVSKIMRIKLPFNVNLAAEIGGLVALDNLFSILEITKKIVSERGRVYDALNKIFGITVYPSEANFLFIMAEGNLLDLKNHLENNLIFPRYYNEHNSLRLTIGRPDQNDRIIACFNSLDRNTKFI